MQCPKCNHAFEEKEEIRDVIDELEPEEASEKKSCCPQKKPRQKMYKPSWILIGMIGLLVSFFIIFILANGSLHTKERNDLFEDGLCPIYVSEENAFGYVNKKGELVIAAEYEDALPFSYRLAAVKKDGKWGYVNTKGEMVIKAEYSKALSFARNGLAPVSQDGLWGYVSRNGAIAITPQFVEAESFGKESLALVRARDGLYGYINRRGLYVIEPKFYKAESFDVMGYAIVFSSHGGYGMINKQGEFVINPQFDLLEPFSSNGVALVEQGGLYGYVNRDGLYIIEPQYRYAESFTDNGLALVYVDGEGFGFINKRGDLVVDAIYDSANSFSDGFASVRKDGVWHFIDKNGEAITEPRYLYADDAETGLALATDKDGHDVYVNKKGEEVIRLDAGAEGTRFCTDGYALVYDAATDAYHIINKKGEVIFS